MKLCGSQLKLKLKLMNVIMKVLGAPINKIFRMAEKILKILNQPVYKSVVKVFSANKQRSF